MVEPSGIAVNATERRVDLGTSAMRLRLVLVLTLILCGFIGVRMQLVTMPYFDDELGYFAPHALKVLDGPHRWIALLSGYAWHPPLLDVVVVIAWRVFGYSLSFTRTLSMAMAAVSLVLTGMLGNRIGGAAVGIGAALLAATTPPFFFHAASLTPEMLVTPLSLAAVYAGFRGRPMIGSVALGLAALAKPTAPLIAPVLFAYAILEGRAGGLARGAAVRRAMPFIVVPLLLTAVWLFAQLATPGVNVVVADSGRFADSQMAAVMDRFWNPRRVGVNLVVRTFQLAVFDFRWLLSVALIGVAVRMRHEIGVAVTRVSRDLRVAEWAVVTASASLYVVTFSIIGRELLPRYLVPAFPFFLISVTAALRRAAPRLSVLVIVGTAAVFALSSRADVYRLGPYLMGAWNDHAIHAEMARAYQSAFAFVDERCQSEWIMANYPAEMMARDPRLGYVSHAHQVAVISHDASLAWPLKSRTVIVVGQQLAPLDAQVLDALPGRRRSFGTGRSEVFVIDPGMVCGL